MNMERQRKPEEFLMPGMLSRPEDSWCVTCAKSTFWVGPVWKITTEGMRYWGTIEGCAECDNWVWKNDKGLITQVDVYRTIRGL
jgi:hypothetical protein